MENRIPALVLVTTNISNIPRIIKIYGSKFTIGNDPCASLIIAHESVTKFHCILENTFTNKWTLRWQNKSPIFLKCGNRITIQSLASFRFLCSPDDNMRCCFHFKSRFGENRMLFKNENDSKGNHSSNESVKSRVSQPQIKQKNCRDIIVRVNDVEMIIPIGDNLKRERLIIGIKDLKPSLFENEQETAGLKGSVKNLNTLILNNIRSYTSIATNTPTTINNDCCEIIKSQIKGLMDTEFECSICSDLLVDPTVTNCNHLFCFDCLKSWKIKQNSCPLCREKLSENLCKVPIIDEFITNLTKLICDDHLQENRLKRINEIKGILHEEK